MQLSYAKYFFLNFKKAYRSWAPGIVPKRWQPEGLLFGVHAFNCNQLLFLVEKKNFKCNWLCRKCPNDNRIAHWKDLFVILVNFSKLYYLLLGFLKQLKKKTFIYMGRSSYEVWLFKSLLWRLFVSIHEADDQNYILIKIENPQNIFILYHYLKFHESLSTDL